MASDIDEERQCQAKVNEIASSFMDKKLILDARDKLFRLKQERQTNIATAVALVGTCLDMCPEQERYFRIETNCVSSFEMDSNGVPDETKMVKEYRRSGADQKEPLPHELRPIDVLQRSMNYLCLKIIDEDAISKGANVGDWFDFVWSRTRSIRKDITQQHLINKESVCLIEKCARFHIFCAYYLCEEEIRDFDPKINEENLYNCLQTLKEFYFDLSTRSIYCPNEAEFRSYDILLNLRNCETLSELKHYRKEIRDCDDIRFAVKIYQAFHSKNHIKFFQLARKANFLMSCILNNYFNQFRIDILNIMRRAYTIPKSNSFVPYPVEDFIQQFAFDDLEELAHFCDLIDLKYDTENIYLRRTLSIYTTSIKRRSKVLVQDKLKTTPGRAILSQTNQVAINELILPIHSSFDQNNRLIFDVNSLSSSSASSLSQDENANKVISPIAKLPLANSQEPEPKFNNGFKFPVFNIKAPEKAQPKIESPFSFSNQVEKLSSSKTPFSSLPNGSLFTLPTTDKNHNSTSSSFTFNMKSRTITPNENNLELEPSELTEPKPIEPPQKPEVDVVTISEAMKQSIFTGLLSQLTRQECQMSIERHKERKALLTSESNKCYNYLIVSLIHEIANEAVQSEKRKKLFILKSSQDLMELLLSEIVTSSIKETYFTFQTSHRRKCASSLANELYQELFDCILSQLAQQVLLSETESRDSEIKRWRHIRLQRKYWLKWRTFYLARKKYKFYRDSFPAAPLMQHVGCNKDIVPVNRTAIDGISYMKAYDELKRKLVYSKYKNPAEMNRYLKERLNTKIALQDKTFQLEQLKRTYYLESKYFKLWLFKVRIRKRNFIRTQFPAAPTTTFRQSHENRFTNSLTLSDPKMKDATESLKRNLLKKLNCDFDSTIAQIKRKLDQREQLRLSHQTMNGIHRLQMDTFQSDSSCEPSPKRFLPYPS